MIKRRYFKVFEITSVRGFTCLDSDPEFEYSHLSQQYDTQAEAEKDLNDLFTDPDDEPRVFTILPIYEVQGEIK